MPKANSWYVITGGPSTGKSSLLAELEKHGLRVVPEAARVIIDERLDKGQTIAEIRSDEAAFQYGVLKRKQLVESRLDKTVPTFFDRGMQDTIAYFRYYGYKLAPWTAKLFAEATYQKVFLLEPLANFTPDYSRTENAEFSRQIHQLLQDAYIEYGVKPILVPAVSLSERAEFVIESTSFAK